MAFCYHAPTSQNVTADIIRVSFSRSDNIQVFHPVVPRTHMGRQLWRVRARRAQKLGHQLQSWREGSGDPAPHQAFAAGFPPAGAAPPLSCTWWSDGGGSHAPACGVSTRKGSRSENACCDFINWFFLKLHFSGSSFNVVVVLTVI